MSADLSHLLSWPKTADGRPLRVVVVGAGNLGHVLVGQLGARPDVQVAVLSRKAEALKRAGMLKNGVSVAVQSPNHQVQPTTVVGRPSAISSDPSEVIPQADVILLTVPSHAQAGSVKRIAPFIDKDRAVCMGVMPGMGGFNWIAGQICQFHQLRNVILFGLKDVPFMSAFVDPGKSVMNLGAKKELWMALAAQPVKSAARRQHEKQMLAALCTELTGIHTTILPNYLTITLTPGNVMHPCIMYGEFGPYSQWDGKPLRTRPLMYEQISQLSAYFLEKCDEEIQRIKTQIQEITGVDLSVVWSLRVNIKRVYGDLVVDNSTLLRAIRSNRAYQTIRIPLRAVYLDELGDPATASASAGASSEELSPEAEDAAPKAANPAAVWRGPVARNIGYVPDVGHRFFQEDVPFVLVVLRGIAEMIGVATPIIDEIILWAQKLMGKEYLVKGRLTGRHIHETGAPRVYGALTIYDLVADAQPASPSPGAPVLPPVEPSQPRQQHQTFPSPAPRRTSSVALPSRL